MKNLISSSRCKKHNILVNDMGIYQCVDCLCLFNKKGLELSLKEVYNNNWSEELELLRSLKRRVLRGNATKPKIYEYEVGNGRIITRIFYDK